MDKKVIIALLMSMAVLFLYPYYVERFYPKQEAPKKEAPVDTAVEKGKAPGAAVTARPEAPSAKEELTSVETPLYKAVLTSRGGAVKSFELKKYIAKKEDGSEGVKLSETIAKNNSFKTVIEINGVLEEIAFHPSSANVTVPEGGQGELVYNGATSTGLKIEKRYTFSADTYFISTELTAQNPTNNALSARALNILTAATAGKDKDGYHTGPLVRTKDKLIRQDADELQKTGSGELKWLGLEDKYFLSALVPVSNGTVSWTTEVASTTQSGARLELPLSLEPGAVKSYKYSSFIGPKEYDRLLKQKNNLEEAIEFGWFDWMAKPFLVVLNFFNRYIGNYGIAIILITIIIKVIFYPLTKKSLNSMNEMKKMQPQMAAIREKYKDNKEKMNKELMDLYKRYKVNPLGGCLPIVLQIPVFIALYEVLYVAIELRHAPFYLWIHDLSAKDPYYVTPLLMGATMFIQQKMTPTSVDPTQAKVMLIMPVIFTFMFLNFPSGLVIYWLVNNVLSIAQQYYIQKAPAKA